ncbi:MAG: protein arginine kinase [Thermaerobacter sp.]|nr:protein arginine kinase [Thermaerobacter sp.]
MEYRAKWATGEMPYGPIVISSRVRLARNLKDLPFPGTMSQEAQREVLSRIERVLRQPSRDNYQVLRMAELPQNERLALVEEHLISYDLANQREGAVALSPESGLSVMLNEEDHLRIQCVLGGLDLDTAWQGASRCDDLLESELDFAFHEQYGYLTACPTNVGTGMRASVMLHLPALVESGQIGRVLMAIGQFGLMARGLYGEGTEARGHIFQISNQVTSGVSEEEVVRNLKAVTLQIVGQEQALQKKMLAANRPKIEDRVFRALGILTNARMLDSSEAMTLLSELRLGVSAGLLSLPLSLLSELLVLIQPGVLQSTHKQELHALERDVKRAEAVRSRLLEALRREKK